MKLRSAWRVIISTMMGDREIYVTNDELSQCKFQYSNPQRVFIMSTVDFNKPNHYSSLFPPF